MAYTWDSTSQPDLRFIIIGNGFDIECGLDTKYQDFLTFVREGNYDKLVLSSAGTTSLDWQRFRKYNFWYNRFNSIQIGNGWVDFENEIARIVTYIERSMLREDGSTTFMTDDIIWDTDNNSKQILFDASFLLDGRDIDIQSYHDLVKILIDDLNELTKYFESYLFNYVITKKADLTKAIKRLISDINECDNTRVISFNYTKTLEVLLEHEGIDVDFCYVHGTISDGKDKNGMVLGIDERASIREPEMIAAFGPFRKYNQRIYKRTDSHYMDWLSEVRLPYEQLQKLRKMEEQLLLSSGREVNVRATRERISILRDDWEKKKVNKEVIVFGHSLGITDKDILKSFLTLSDTRTVIYYYDEDSFSSLVSNITAILGVDEVITRTGGKNRTMEFRNQYD